MNNIERETIPANIIFPEGFHEECLDCNDVEEKYARIPGDIEYFIDKERFEYIISYINNVDGDNCAAFWVLIIRRKSDSTYFKIEYDESHEGGSSIFYETGVQVFPTQVISVTYE